MKIFRVFFAALALTAAARAEVKLPSIISDHMVVQADTTIPIWGWAEPGEQVTVSLGGQSQTATAGADGKWTVKLGKYKAGGEALTLTAKGKNTVTVNDVLVGEVWLGSGQSNMALQVTRVTNAADEIAAAQLPTFRMFTVRSGPAASPQEDCVGTWQVCDVKTVPLFSAAAFFFGRELQKALGVPVGMINSSVGGTPIESWISSEAQENSPELKAAFEEQAKSEAGFNVEAAKAKYEADLAKWKDAEAKAKAAGKKPPTAPRDPLAVRRTKGGVAGLFNGKIAPLIPYALRGAIWYQGEANSSKAKAGNYQYQLPLLIADWRTRWGYDFPFAWVQLPNFDGGPLRDWPMMREAMLKTLKVKNTGMAIAIDIGEPKDIHPKNKQEVGRRLGLWALGTVYGKKVASISGPLPAGHKVKGSEVVLEFSHADGGLVAKDGELKGFVIAGEDKQWKPAQAKIDGGKVIVSSAEVKQPVAVRYAWENNPECNLTNGAGLPASPFRTDDWK